MIRMMISCVMMDNDALQWSFEWWGWGWDDNNDYEKSRWNNRLNDDDDDEMMITIMIVKSHYDDENGDEVALW